MDPDEIFIAVVSLGLALTGLQLNSTHRMHRLFFRDTRWIGLTRLATGAAMLWILFVLLKFADPSVAGIYVWFYLLMGYAVVKTIAPLGAWLFGVRFRVDICERRNPAAAVFHAAFVLATGMIFGGCLWGEADPVGDDEGGWWIPLGFFFAGWGALLVAIAVFFWREPGPTRLRIRRDRNLPEARAAAAYTLVAAWLLTEAVAGDFYGWRHGLMAVGFIFGLLVVHDVFAFAEARATALVGSAGRSRLWEILAYVATGIVFWIISRSLEGWLAKMT
jgi:hypothetical protein